MSYWDHEKEYSTKGIDYDLGACLDYNPQDGLEIDDIEKVLAVHEGERDEEDWQWILQLTNGKFAYLRGGCDYTGWDCQSWASHAIIDNPQDAIEILRNRSLPTTEKQTPFNAGIGHMLEILSGTFDDNIDGIATELEQQLVNGKNKTWREEADKDMPDAPAI